MTQESFDLVVIGGGPAGYQAAIRAGQLGLRTACVESRGALGGTCLNVGCIPSKALLQSTESYHAAQHKLKELGVVLDKVGFDLAQILKRKNTIVRQLTSGIEGLFKKNKVTYVKGYGSFAGPGQIAVKGDDGTSQTLLAKNVLIATGSEPIELPMAKFDEKQIVSSTGALDFEKVPEHLVVIGGGVIGLEMGSVWGRLGAKVTVIEALDNILAMMDGDIIKAMVKVLKKDGMEFHVGTKFKDVKKTGKGLTVIADKGGETLEIPCDKLLVAVGRRAFTQGLNAEKIGLKLDDRGRVDVDDHFQTNVPNVYAVGDVVRGAMLAHKAEEEGVACVEMIAGKPGHVNYEAIPNIIYTWPEVASVGRSEEQCAKEGIPVRIGKVPFSANARAKCAGETEGFVKLIADARTDRLLGAHIVGAHASELIAELVIAFEYQASSEDVARSVHGHPTMAEVIKEAALAVDKRSINF